MSIVAYSGWLKPSLLLCVRGNGGSRCHELAEKLAGLGFDDVTFSTLYPTLRRMENGGS